MWMTIILEMRNIHNIKHDETPRLDYDNQLKHNSVWYVPIGYNSSHQGTELNH